MSWQQKVGKYDGCFESTTQKWSAFKNALCAIPYWTKLLHLHGNERLNVTKTAIRRDFGLEWPASSNWIYHRSWLGWDISWLNTLNHPQCSEEESADWWHNREKPEHSEFRSLIIGIFVAKVPEGETGVVLPCSSSSIWQGFRWRFKMMWCRLWLWYLDILSKLAEDRESRPDRLLRTRIPLRDFGIVNYS